MSAFLSSVGKCVIIKIHQTSHTSAVTHPRNPVRPKPLVRGEARSEFNRDSAVAVTSSPEGSVLQKWWWLQQFPGISIPEITATPMALQF